MFHVNRSLRTLSRISLANTATRRYSSRIHEIVANELQATRDAGTFKSERVITTPQRSTIRVQDPNNQSATTPQINMCANNYLGLSDHPAVVARAKEYLDTHGAGLSSVRFICGTQDIHKKLEKQISDFYGTEDTILYASCFDANGGIFEVLLNEQDAIISDALNHASIIDGVRLCKAKRFRYQNCDVEDLEKQLQAADSQGARLKMIATDGVFSMDGKIAPLDKICDIAEKYDAVLFVDDCHATGFLGKTGRGTPEYFGVQDRVHIVNSTLGKALGGAAGGYTTSTADIISLLRNRSRPYLFSNSLPSPVVGAASAAIQLVDEGKAGLDHLWANTHLFRGKLKAAGFTVNGDNHPITPVMLGDARLAAEFADEMLQKGIYVVGFSYPVVPKGQARIRVQLSAAHTTEEVEKAADAFIEIGRRRGVIPSANKL
ncbi:2-amino-3-ketobutyrate coenzyme A ligase [Basidiobolus meristosporus CBS 931.73]|uniref:2-amino-3-ketobutyrate coenzyme A ligase, mitochondrial n=1 Tax=Basidiobolus meristosporus CBS 931.73 TaxID=1314790 RepID=A0A1Y1YR27_9FUNG|nr:2-amino-3-ketobutyrate coenzyme A ligase [Basidiobolus meristosporus CBS 931.73]|eukprot:ORY00416.1 2-amino-3-ketobutyrate coenzyme A ligase [Basidiobolus meristosporus CBS 931.73]